MDTYQTLSHSKWECKYHVVFIPKYRRKQLFGRLRKELGSGIRQLELVDWIKVDGEDIRSLAFTVDGEAAWPG